MKSLRLQGAGVWPWLALFAAGVLAGGRLGAAIVAVALLAGLLAVGAAISPGRSPRASLRRHLPRQPVTAGDDVPVTVEGQIRLGWPIVLARLEDDAPKPLRGLSGPWRLGGHLHAEYMLRAVPRGLYRFTDCRATLRDGLGLVQRSVAIPLPGELLVYPQRAQVALGGMHSQSWGDEEVARGTRDFLPGDRPSRLHAARTAQRGYPQVRESTPPPQQSRTLRLHCPEASLQDVELAISAAASLSEALLAAGFAVGLSLQGASLAPRRGQDQLGRILTELARASGPRLTSAAEPPMLPDGHGDPWLIVAGSAALRSEQPFAGVVLRVGAELRGDAVRSLGDLAAWAGRLES